MAARVDIDPARVDESRGVRVTTYQDLLDHLVDYGGADVQGDIYRDARRAIQEGARTFSNHRPWTYFMQRGRLQTVAQQTAGSVQYAQATLQVTLTGSTWPSWASLAVINILGVSYNVASVQSSTILTLSVNSNPGADVVAGTSYYLYQDTFTLPGDFISTDEFLNRTNFRRLVYVHPSQWLEMQRLNRGPAGPSMWTVTGDPRNYGAMVVRFFPAPDNVYAFDFMYRRRARPLLIDSYSAGTVTTGASSTAVTGSGTAWTAGMVGSVFRASLTTDLPTGLSGKNPPAVERSVIAVGSATSLTLDAVAGQTLSAVGYRISDPVDMEDGAMFTAMMREIELQFRLARRMETTRFEAESYRMALLQAMESDSRSMQARASGKSGVYPYRLAYMPTGPDVP